MEAIAATGMTIGDGQPRVAEALASAAAVSGTVTRKVSVRCELDLVSASS